MLKEPKPNYSEQSTAPASESFENLRSLMLGEDYERAIKSIIETDDTQRVTNVLSEAFQQRNQQDNSLAVAISPVIETAIEESIRNNPRRITDVIYPIMGPAVRKAVANALADMVRSFNYLLQQSLSIKALNWRFNAWRLGIPYVQYVVFKNLQYRVEQVFLIHKETGNLIQSAQASGIVYQDPSLVSSMLTAITDFISDSFQQTQSINEIQFGEVSLLIESGPNAVLAFAVRGNTQDAVKQCLVETLEVIHKKYAKQLVDYNGDNLPLESSHSLLESALIQKSKVESKTKPWLALIIIVAAALALSWWSFIQWQNSVTHRQIENIIKQQPGYQFLYRHNARGKMTFEVLRSPSAITLAELKKLFPAHQLDIEIQAKLTILDDLQLVALLLQKNYQGSRPIKFSVQDKQLILNGAMEKIKLAQLHTDPQIVQLFDSIDSSQVKIIAPLTEIQANDKVILSLINDVKNQLLRFESASELLDTDSQLVLNEIILKLKRMLSLQAQSNIKILQISVIGFADHQGRGRVNHQLSEQRAASIATSLRNNQIDPQLIVSWGSGSQDLSSVPAEIQRRAEVDILYSNDGDQQ